MHNNMGLTVPLSSELSVTGRVVRLVLQTQDHSKLNKQFGSTSQRWLLKLQYAGKSLWGGELKCRV